MRRVTALILLLVFLPVCAPAEGTLRTVTEDAGPEEQFQVASEYTGEVKITFLGDCTLGGENPPRYPQLDFATRIAENGPDYPFRELIRLTGEDDLTVANLEGVLTDRELPKVEKRFNFSGATAYTEILKRGSVECVTLANNHAHDYGEAGYRDTKDALEKAGVCWFAMDAPAIWQNEDGLKIGFLGVGSSLSGDRYTRYKTQAEWLKNYGCAAVITVMHAGTEYDLAPPDTYQAQITGRAVQYSQLVIGHHPHIIQGYTVLKGVPVVYSLGNCVFGGNTFPKDLDAMTVQAVLHFTEGELDGIDLHFYPIRVTGKERANDYSPRLLTGKEAERVLKKMTKTTGMDPGPWDEEEGAVVSFTVPAS